MTFSTLKLGAGGFVNGISIANDGTKAIRTDVGGGYTSVSNAQWVQTLAVSKLPPSDPAIFLKAATGLYEIAVAPSDSTRLYMYFSPSDSPTDGYVYVSSNTGATWQATGFSSVPAIANDQAQEGMGPHIAIDPHNPDVVLVGTPSSGVFRSTNAGGVFTHVTDIPSSTTNPPGSGQGGGHGIAFDTNSWTSGNTPGVYVTVYGIGVYHSINNGANFTFINSTNMPTTYWQIFCGPDGNVWVIEAAGTLKKYNGTAWSAVSAAPTLNAIAINPLNGLEIVTMASGNANLGYSSNGGTSFSSLALAATSTDIPWLTANSVSNPLDTMWPQHTSIGRIQFDPSTASATAGQSTIWLSEGTGVWHCQVTTSGTQTFTSKSAGIEELVVDWISSPPGGNTIVACFDRPVFTITDPTNSTYCLSYGPTFTQNILEGYACDYSPLSPSTLVVLAQNGPNDQLYYSTNGGGSDGSPANWTRMSGQSQILDMVNNSVGSGGVGGHIAASTSTNFAIALNNGSGGNTGIWYTTDAGANWGRAVNTNFTGGNEGWGNNRAFNRHIICADPLTAGTFYAYNSLIGTGLGGIYRSTDQGHNWTQQSVGRFDTSISPTADQFHARLQAAPGTHHLYYTSGQVDGTAGTCPFHFSTDGAGVTWNSFPGVTDVWAFGFGKPLTGSTGYPTIYLYGYVGGSTIDKLGIWQGYNLDTTPVWTQLSTQYINDSLDFVTAIDGDKNTEGKFYVGFKGTGALVFAPAATTSTPPVGFSVIHGHGGRHVKMIGY